MYHPRQRHGWGMNKVRRPCTSPLRSAERQRAPSGCQTLSATTGRAWWLAPSPRDHAQRHVRQDVWTPTSGDPRLLVPLVGGLLAVAACLRTRVERLLRALRFAHLALRHHRRPLILLRGTTL